MTVQPQSCSNWCWAAVASSISNYFYPNAQPPLTQCDLAYRTYRYRGSPVVSLSDCCDTPCSDDDPTQAWNASIDPMGIGDPLWVARVVSSENEQPLASSATTDAMILDALDRHAPVCAIIDWGGGACHVVAIVGAGQGAGGVQNYVVSDPKTTAVHIVSRQQLETAYQSLDRGPSGRWEWTYFTERPVK